MLLTSFKAAGRALHLRRRARCQNGAAGTGRCTGTVIGPEWDTVSRPDLVASARAAADADYDVLVACALCYEADASEFGKLGRIPVLRARMNGDLHMAGDLKNTGKGNLFVNSGEPEIEIVTVDRSEPIAVGYISYRRPNRNLTP